MVLLYGSARKELSEGYRLTTNNRMEVLAVIKGLEALKEPCQVTLYSDSKYVVDAIQKGWVKKWKANGWYRNKKEKASISGHLIIFVLQQIACRNGTSCQFITAFISWIIRVAFYPLECNLMAFQLHQQTFP